MISKSLLHRPLAFCYLHIRRVATLRDCRQIPIATGSARSSVRMYCDRARFGDPALVSRANLNADLTDFHEFQARAARECKRASGPSSAKQMASTQLAIDRDRGLQLGLHARCAFARKSRRGYRFANTFHTLLTPISARCRTAVAHHRHDLSGPTAADEHQPREPIEA